MHDTFADLVSPCTVDRFFQEYYERKHLHIVRNVNGYYDSILNVADIDSFFQRNDLDCSSLRVVRDGEELSSIKWTFDRSSRVNNDKLFILFNQGYTLIITAANRSILKLINYSNDLEKELKFGTQFNIYITPRNAHGFAHHYDDHDVFILQVHGSKIWRLYGTPVQLPSRRYPHKKFKGTYELGSPQFEDQLVQGDLLYIPRGLLHDAVTTDTVSVHITLGLHPNYWFELLQEVASLAEDMPEFRRAIPNALMSEDTKKKFREEFQSLTQALLKPLDVHALLQRQFDRFMRSKSFEDQHRFTDSIQLSKLNANSILSRRESIPFQVYRDDKNVTISFYDKKVDFPHFVWPSIDTLVQRRVFAVKDIGGLITDEGRIDLATKLIQEGFLTIDNINAET